MRKHSAIILGALLLIVSMGVTAEARTYKIAHALAADHPYTPALELFAREVDKRTDGRIQFDVLHSGVLGGEVEMIPQLISGTLDGLVLGGVVIFESFNPLACTEDLPYLFKSLEHGRRATDGDYGKLMNTEVIEPLGIKVLGYMDYGFRHFTNNKRALNKPTDLQGIKFRSGPVPMRLKMFAAFNSTAVPIAFPELFQALQQGTVDGQENSLAIIDSSKYYEAQKYLSLSAHVLNVSPVMLNKALWESFSKEDKQAVQEAARIAIDYERELISKAEAEAVEKLKKLGMQVNTPDKQAFAEATKPVWDYYREKFGAKGQAFIDAAAKYE